MTAISGPEKTSMEKVLDALPSLPAFTIGEMKFPEMKIGEVVSIAENVLQKIRSGGELMSGSESDPNAVTGQSSLSSTPAPSQPFTINRFLRYCILGDDKKKYGPISGAKLMEWLAEGRVHAQTLAQTDGRTDWKPLVTFAETDKPPPVPMAPSIRLAPRPEKSKK